MFGTINTNVMSLNTQRNLLKSSTEMASAIKRVSSGLRINSAKDDAAGLAISERMTAQIRGMSVGVRNANDGLSLTQMADAALQTVTDNMQRLRELAVQSANSTNTPADLEALNTEAKSLLTEINRVANQTQFNGQNLTDGTFSSGIFQVGANSGETITVATLTNVKTSALGRVPTFPYLPNTNTDDGAGIATTTGTGISNLAATDLGTLIISDVAGFPYNMEPLPPAKSIKERMGQVVEAVNKITTKTGVSAAIDGATNAIVLTSKFPIKLSGSDNGSLTGIDTAAKAGESGSLDTLNLSSYAGSQLALQQLDGALQTVNAGRAMMGAMQMRFESAVTSLQTDVENLSDARSHIQDADIAAEMAKLTRAQVLQQAGMAMLSQANSTPQSVLSLLKN